MKKRIYLMVTSYFPRPDNAWTCSFTYDQARAIERTSGYRVVILNPNSIGNYNFRGIDVIGFKEHVAGKWVAPQLFQHFNTKRMFRVLSEARVAVSDIDVAHGHLVTSAGYLLALKKARKTIKTVLQFHDPDPLGMLFGVGRFRCLKRILYFLYHRALVEKMDLLVAISENVARVIREAPRQTVFNDYAQMKKAMTGLRCFRPAVIRKLCVLHNGVDKEIFHPSPNVRHGESAFVIGCVALFRDWKDQISLLRAVESLKGTIPGLFVKLVGVPHSGGVYDECQRMIVEKQLPVEIIPSIDHRDLPAFYQSLDLFVLPSYFEGFGCVFLEAHVCGTPFVTCEGQGMDDYIAPEDRTLWLCRIRDPVDLAAKIYRYYRERRNQRLTAETDIDVLISDFLRELNLLKIEGNK